MATAVRKSRVKPTSLPAPTGKLADAFRHVLPIPSNIEKVKQQAALLRDRRQKLLPIENALARRLDQSLAALDLQADDLIKSGYRPMSLEPLLWRELDRGTQLQMPVLALFDVEQGPKTTIQIPSYSSAFNCIPALPAPLRDCYRDLRRGYNYTADFRGVIPDEVREVISGLITQRKLDHTQRRRPFERVFLLAETQWTISQRNDLPPVRRDPLVLGWNGKSLWYVTHFDVTPLEEYIKAEFPE